jgi:hypothetical protein
MTLLKAAAKHAAEAAHFPRLAIANTECSRTMRT